MSEKDDQQLIRSALETLASRFDSVDSHLGTLAEQVGRTNDRVDKLVEVMSRMTRVEEMQQEHQRNHQRLWQRLEDSEDECNRKHDEIKTHVTTHDGQIDKLLESRGWMLAGFGIILIAVLAAVLMGVGLHPGP